MPHFLYIEKLCTGVPIEQQCKSHPNRGQRLQPCIVSVAPRLGHMAPCKLIVCLLDQQIHSFVRFFNPCLTHSKPNTLTYKKKHRDPFAAAHPRAYRHTHTHKPHTHAPTNHFTMGTRARERAQTKAIVMRACCGRGRRTHRDSRFVVSSRVRAPSRRI